MKNELQKAMQATDDLVVQLDYKDSKGEKTRRVVSPIRFLPNGRFLGLCLCRCAPRQFHLDRCENVQLRKANDYVMPVPMITAS